MQIIRMSAAERNERNERKAEEIRLAEEKRYYESFGRIPTKEERNDWFRSPVTGLAMNHNHTTK